MQGSWKTLCPNLVMDFKGLGETPEDATKDNVHITTQMNLGVSTEDVDELSSSYSQWMSSEDLIDIQEENKTPPTKAKDDDCQSPTTKLS
jgi:hypothetical protein